MTSVPRLNVRSSNAWTLVLAVLGAAPLTSAALGTFISPVSQTRSVSGTAFGEDETSGPLNDAASTSAPDFGDFDEGRFADVSLDEGNGSGGGTQHSSINDATISASGSMFAVGDVWGGQGEAGGSGQSRFIVTFDLLSAAQFEFDLTIAAYDSSAANFSFNGPGGAVVDPRLKHNVENVFHDSGTLAAGTYTINLVETGSAYGSGGFADYASGEYNLSLRFFSLAGPEDINNDGAINVDDLIAVILNWGACAGCAADVNGDGTVDVDDLSAVILAWS